MEEAKKIAKRINEDTIVYDNFHKVILNLQECPNIDITKVMANQLYKALDPKWCFGYDELIRERGNQPAVEQ